MTDRYIIHRTDRFRPEELKMKELVMPTSRERDLSSRIQRHGQQQEEAQNRAEISSICCSYHPKRTQRRHALVEIFKLIIGGGLRLSLFNLKI